MKSKRAITILGSILVLAIATTAYAYFTATGSGTGSASVGTASPFTVTFGATTGGPLLPGSGHQTLPYTVTNPGSGSQQLTTTTAAVASSGGFVTQSGAPASGCLAAWFTAENNPPAAVDLGPGDSTTGVVNVTMTDSGTNQDPCQGVAPDITVTAS
ncbi:MAG TPA: hypothetical protein VHZ75_00550 [Solirubrobacteraceae bacterium]|nr:hypothetical protein [Solirubrobacteraceae bacterium]